MYSTCLFCHSSLGQNEILESFPVGRRVAFDAAKGRLWAVCRFCDRWNLAPLHERWEAIESCERLFRDTRRRVSTENIGLASVPGGLELVRVGKPLGQELAAWRYGRHLTRRRQRAFVRAGLGVGAVAGGVAAITPLAPLIAGSLPIIGWSAALLMYWLPERVQQELWASVRGKRGQRINVARVPLTSGEVLEVTRSDLRGLQLQQGWTANPIQLVLQHDWGAETLSGADALHAAALVLPAINRFGGSPARVSEALEVLESAGGVEALWDRCARNRPALAQLPHPISLALEMAAHEEAEQEALRGELTFLERAWQEAEEIAAIADQLVMPTTVQRALDRLRSTRPGLTRR